MDEKLLREIFPQKLKHYMQLHDKKRNDLVRDLSFKYSTIRDWEKGITIPRADKAEALARYFNITVADLIGDPAVLRPTLPTLSPAEVGAELQQILTERNTSPTELDEQAGIKTGTTAKIIKGKYEPNLDVAAKIAKVLDIAPSLLLGVREDKQSIQKQRFITRLYEEIPNFCPTDDDEIRQIINYIKFVISQRK